MPRWFLVACAALAVFAISLFSLRPQVESSIPHISLVAEILGLLLTVLYAERRLTRPAADPQERRKLTRKKFLVAAGAAALAIAVGVTGWFIWSTSEIRVTGQLALSGEGHVVDRGMVTIGIPGEPPNRDRIRLTPVITNKDKTGACVTPAWLELTAIVDGHAADTVTVRSGDQADLSIEGSSGATQVRVVVRQADPACVVTLEINEAVLYG